MDEHTHSVERQRALMQVEVLRLTEVPSPRPAAGEVLIEVSARPVHPADHAFVRGQYRVQPVFPQVAGLEGVGTILEYPPNSGYAVGQRVAFRWPRSWANLAAVPIDRLIEVPTDVRDSDACQISLNPLTAWGLLDSSQAREGDWILITAATSTVANLIVSICRVRKINTIGIVRGAVSESVSRCSADLVLSATDPRPRCKDYRAGRRTADCSALGQCRRADPVDIASVVADRCPRYCLRSARARLRPSPMRCSSTRISPGLDSESTAGWQRSPRWTDESRSKVFGRWSAIERCLWRSPQRLTLQISAVPWRPTPRTVA